MTERESLLAAILADPADDTVRLVFADWLDEKGERGEADSRWAAMIRGRLDPAGPQRLVTTLPWVADLVERFDTRLVIDGYCHVSPTVQVVGELVSTVEVLRGFVDLVALGTTAFHTNAAHIFAGHPITRASLIDGPEPIRLTRGPHSGMWFVPMRDVPEWLHEHIDPDGVCIGPKPDAEAVLQSISDALVAFGCDAAGVVRS